VKPGILVRQRFTDADIGLDKSEALKGHLEALGLVCAVTAERSDLGYKALARFDLTKFDLVIDATASTRVAQRIEEELKAQALPVPLISVAVSAAAANGSVAVKMPGFRGGPHNIARLAKLQAFARHGGHPLVKAFWPERGTLPIFQPEPGCSAPTFVGSAADIDHHAAGLLNVGLAHVRAHGEATGLREALHVGHREIVVTLPRPRAGAHVQFAERRQVLVGRDVAPGVEIHGHVVKVVPIAIRLKGGLGPRDAAFV